LQEFIITIDGPAGAGKTTVSRILAHRLGYKYIDTGALYRGVAYEARAAGVSPDNDEDLEKLCSALNLKFVRNEKGVRLLSNGLDITDQIRAPEITMLASGLSAKPLVRRCLLDLQRAMAKGKGVVVEGRDMGTVVFPNAKIKFYLDASQKTRVARRHRELQSISSQTVKDVEKDIRKRDKNDSTRFFSPLKPAEDAIIIDSTHLSVHQVVELMLRYIENAF
jgi:cytidylate kinase